MAISVQEYSVLYFCYFQWKLPPTWLHCNEIRRWWFPF